MVIPQPVLPAAAQRRSPPSNAPRKVFAEADTDSALDPYSPNFDCSKAPPAAVRLHDSCEALQRLLSQVVLLDAGEAGGSYGRDNVYLTGFTWIDDVGQHAVSTLAARAIGEKKEAFSFSSSVANERIDSVLIGQQLVPISRLTGVFRHHPTNMRAADPSRLPLPTTYVQLPGGLVGGDYQLLYQLIQYGASDSIILGVSAERGAGNGYELFVYPFQDLPTVDSRDAFSGAESFGRTVSNLKPCNRT